MDDIEAVGINLLSKLGAEIPECSSRPTICKKTGGVETNINRHFGGLNVLLSGDFWQPHPLATLL
eukprot:2867858-Karenia_brevis.AAC.1